MNQQNNNSSASWGYRFVAILALAISVLAVVVIPFDAISAATADGKLPGVTLLDLIMKAVDGGNKMLGFIPAFALPGTIGTVYNLSIYLFAACLAVAAGIALINIFAGEGGLARTAVCLLSLGALFYTISYNLAVTKFYNLEATKIVPDMFSLIIAVACAVLYFIMALIKIGKIAWLHFLQFILSVAFVALLSRPLAISPALTAETLTTLPMIALYLGLVVVYLNTVIALARMTRAGGMVADLVRFIIVLLSALLVIFAAKDNLLWPVLAAAVATLQIVIVIIQMVKANKKAVEQAVEEATEAATAGFHMEEYAEAYAYEGGPVSGVLMAEEVNPAQLKHEPHVNTAGYDFYNCKSFDPFIASLDADERNSFTEIFILKFKGTMPQLPDYEVGGDNKEFFRKVFIYLGLYRDRIPQNLLAKMYQFSMKI